MGWAWCAPSTQCSSTPSRTFTRIWQLVALWELCTVWNLQHSFYTWSTACQEDWQSSQHMAASLAPQHDAPLFKNHDNLYSTIDAMPMPGGDANWKSFNLCFCPDKELPHNAANWNKTKWEYGIETPANSSTTCFKIQISATNLTTCLTKSMTLMVNITFIM